MDSATAVNRGRQWAVQGGGDPLQQNAFAAADVIVGERCGGAGFDDLWLGEWLQPAKLTNGCI